MSQWAARAITSTNQPHVVQLRDLAASFKLLADETRLRVLSLLVQHGELNVRTLEFMHRAEELVTLSAKPNFKSLGAAFGKRTPRIADAIRAIDSAALAAFRGGAPLQVEVDGDAVPLSPEPGRAVLARTEADTSNDADLRRAG